MQIMMDEKFDKKEGIKAISKVEQSEYNYL